MEQWYFCIIYKSCGLVDRALDLKPETTQPIYLVVMHIIMHIQDNLRVGK